jgi:hypothetical protein
MLGTAHAARAQEQLPPVATEASASAAGTGAPSEADLSRARQLFQRGVALAEQGQFGPAAQRFRDALAIHAAAPVEYNLAAALFELGRYEESFNRAENVQRDAQASPALKERAQKLSRALYPHTARLTITASSSAEEDVVVQVDAQRLAAELMGVPRAVTPGAHHIVAERQGKAISERDVQVPLRTAVIIDVSLIIAEQTAPLASNAIQTVPDASEGVSAPMPSQAKDQDHEKRRRIRLWSGIAAGIVAVGAGVALAVVLSKDHPKDEAAISGDFMPGVLTWK